MTNKVHDITSLPKSFVTPNRLKIAAIVAAALVAAVLTTRSNGTEETVNIPTV